jgi:hypothetical protein
MSLCTSNVTEIEVNVTLKKKLKFFWSISIYKAEQITGWYRRAQL